MKLSRQRQSRLICARYAFKPNLLNYCGPDKNRELLNYLRNNESDGGLEQILKKFETLFPYLNLISRENKINDPFDERVVEAYWIGNDFLKNIKKPKLYEHLVDDLSIKKKLPRKEFNKFNEKFINRIRINAHHSFHVFNIWRRTGYVENPHTLFTMDECRIGWGRVVEIDSPADEKIIKVLYKPLIFEKHKLNFGKIISKNIFCDIPTDVKIGDWVSFHWSSFCDILSLDELMRLKYWTEANMEIFDA